MDFDLVWILLGLPLAFLLGWLASRFDLRQLRLENRRAPKAYFKGLNYLLNEQQDQAIDAFIEAVQNDPDTSELHFALGNLFRRRGEYNRAVRVHEHLLSRGDLPPADRVRAQHALALDFLKAGLLDRAEDALKKLDGTPFENQARLALLAIYERSREWPQAAAIATRLEASGEASFSGRLAHYLCEQAGALQTSGDLASATVLLEKAINDVPDAARPRLQLAALQRSQGGDTDALATLKALTESAPEATPLAAAGLADVALACDQVPAVLALLRARYEQDPALDTMEAIVRLEAETGGGGRHPGHREWPFPARRWRLPDRRWFAVRRPARRGSGPGGRRNWPRPRLRVWWRSRRPGAIPASARRWPAGPAAPGFQTGCRPVS